MGTRIDLGTFAYFQILGLKNACFHIFRLFMQAVAGIFFSVTFVAIIFFSIYFWKLFANKKLRTRSARNTPSIMPLETCLRPRFHALRSVFYFRNYIATQQVEARAFFLEFAQRRIAMT